MLLSLFLTFSKIGLFAIGGAYSFLPLLERELIYRYNWLTKEEFLDVLGMVKIFPGAISIKYATYTGYKVGGVWGAIVANLGNIIAPAIFVIFAFTIYTKYKDLPQVKGTFNTVQIAVFALIIAMAFQLININQLIHIKNLIILILCFTLFIYGKVHPALIIVGAGMVGFFLNR